MVKVLKRTVIGASRKLLVFMSLARFGETIDELFYCETKTGTTCTTGKISQCLVTLKLSMRSRRVVRASD
jgi:hypothetical protein